MWIKQYATDLQQVLFSPHRFFREQEAPTSYTYLIKFALVTITLTSLLLVLTFTVILSAIAPAESGSIHFSNILVFPAIPFVIIGLLIKTFVLHPFSVASKKQFPKTAAVVAYGSASLLLIPPFVGLLTGVSSIFSPTAPFIPVIILPAIAASVVYSARIEHIGMQQFHDLSRKTSATAVLLATGVMLIILTVLTPIYGISSIIFAFFYENPDTLMNVLP